MSQLKSIAWTAFAMCSIGLAVLVGLGSLLLPYAGRFTPQVSGWLEQRLGQSVEISQLSARWEGNGPRLSLKGITLGSGSETLQIDDAEIAVDMLAFVRPGVGLAHFRVLVEEVIITRQPTGGWGLKGLPGGGKNTGLPNLDLLQGMGVRAGNLRLVDPAAGVDLIVGQLELDLRNTRSQSRLSGTLSGAASGGLEFVLESGVAGSRVYLSSTDLDLAQWQQGVPVAGLVAQSGQLNGELWGNVSGGEIVDLQWHGSLDNVALVSAGPASDLDANRQAAPFSFSLTDANVRFSRADQGWVAQLLDGEMETPAGAWPAVALSAASLAQQLTVAADWLPVADVTQLLTMIEPIPLSLRSTLMENAAAGVLRNLQLTFGREGDVVSVNGIAEAEGLSLNGQDEKPGFRGLDMVMAFNGQSVTLSPNPKADVTVSLPEVFRGPIVVSEIDGPMVVNWDGDPSLLVQNLSLRNEGVKANLRLELVANGTRPFVDLTLKVSEGQVVDAQRFWPRNKFKPTLLSWLDTSLLAGTITGGTALLYGDLDDWPFREGEGRFEARAVVEGGRLDYHPDWPIAEDIDAALHFDNRGMSADVPRSRLDTLTIVDASFDMPVYRQPRVELDLNSRESGEDFLTFLKHTPLYESYKPYLEGLKIDGSVRAKARIEIPLRPDLPERSVDGVLTLLGAAVTDEKWQVSFNDTAGDVRFTHEGLSADNLDTYWEGFPSTLSLATGAFVNDPLAAAEARLTGIAPASVFSAELPQLAPLLKRIPDACEWVANLVIGLDGELTSEGRTPRLTVRSMLADTEVQLPAPLSKASGEALSMSLGMDLPEFGNLSLDIADLVKFRFRPAGQNQPWGGTLHLGPGQPEENPNPGLLIEGEMDFIDLDEWQDVVTDFTVAQMPDDQQRWLTAMDLRIARLRYAYREFTNLHLRTSRNNNYWTLHIEADQMEGSLRVPLDPDGRRLLLAEMERLEWPASSQTLGSPRIDPASIPPLRLVAGNVSFDGTPYGSVSFESYPVRNGMHIDHLETQSDTMAISATGDWVLVDGKAESRFGLTITGDELGDIFETFGFSRVIEGGQSIVRLDVNWSGGLSEFEMASLNGDMDVSISNGQIVEVDPGAGRLFGLMSLHSLPRRLTLDFSDLFKTGLTFDTIEGNFQLEQGNAYTENLVIKGPTADIEIKGSTNVASQDYDQVVTVIPEVGATLPIVGALAGGAGGAAAAFLLQNMFGRQIDKISQFHYSITGDFESPLVELIGADDQRLELETARALRQQAEAEAG
ncbi:MAG: YhdP family protein [Lysobacterales bacterium]